MSERMNNGQAQKVNVPALSGVERRVTDDLSNLLATLPPDVVEEIERIKRNDDLIEVILDLGRVPTARYTDGEYMLLDREITAHDIELVLMNVGEFDADNRSGIERTLHRISAIRNRRGETVGLTMRVGRAVYGTINIIRDIVEDGKSVLFLGRPGVGKTTMLREAARILAETKRVVIVDTSNEIGGDGDVPHPAVGKARRMQVPTPNLQHEVMIEAVENHNPEVIVIDEIGRELEAQAARTIAERGVQLIATAHGITLDNLLLNPVLSDLVGGVESVTLSDEEARRRGTQKTVLERRSPPTFDVLIELQNRNTLHIHPDIAKAVDMSLRGYTVRPEVRQRDDHGQVTVQQGEMIEPQPVQRGQQQGGKKGRGRGGEAPQPQPIYDEDSRPFSLISDGPAQRQKKLQPLSVYPYGIARNQLIEVSRRLHVPLNIVDRLEDADALLTLKNFYRKRPRFINDAEQRNISIYVLRSNTSAQIENFIVDTFDLEIAQDEESKSNRALKEAEEAVQAILGGDDVIELAPQTAQVRRQQHELIRQAGLYSHSYGREPERHVRVFRTS